MKDLRITSHELSRIGYPMDGKAKLVAMQTMLRHYQRADKGFVMLLLKDILVNPLVYRKDEVLGRFFFIAGRILSGVVEADFPQVCI